MRGMCVYLCVCVCVCVCVRACVCVCVNTAYACIVIPNDTANWMAWAYRLER